MTRFCMTAGTELVDIIWSANVLPFLRRALPKASLVWECPRPEFKSWLESYPEIDEAVGDVEEMPVPPDIYLILHPFWQPAGAAIRNPLDAVFNSIRQWCAIPEDLPGQPYGPVISGDGPRPAGLPANYLCLDPLPGMNLPLDETLKNCWVTLISYLALSAVQVGPADIPLLPGLIDARDRDPIELTGIIKHSQLFIGADSDSSCLASSLKKPQIWFNFKESNWWWPRGNSPQCTLYQIDHLETMELSELISLAWEKLNVRGSDHAI